MNKIRKGDTVQVIKGKDRGKRGKVIKLLSGGKKALVEAINLVKKHKRATRQDQQGGIMTIEAPIAIANLMFFCKACNRAVRLGFSSAKDKVKTRFCKRCKETV